MRRKFSVSWRSSSAPRKQRKYRANAPLHLRQHMLSAHLAKDLRIYGRSARLRKGDEVTVMRGKYRGTHGKVERVDMEALKIYVDAAKRKRVSGQEVMAPLDASNLKITRLYMEDARRKKLLERKRKHKQEKQQKQEAKEP